MRFENSVMINQPVRQVFEYVTDFHNNAAWQSDILEMEITSDGTFGHGATYRCVNRFMGISIETEGLVTEFEPHRRCCIRITSGIVTGASRLDFEPLDGSTRFTTSGELDLTHFKLAKFLVKRKISQQLKHDMLNLKKILENGNIA
jgi:uncharacterized membrane protein